ncbi:MAG: TonB-dependent receptor, partial [Planctomycetaceae bacterium]|nr:TonB-dependent receptor [Planctomycetaceae bacterium]
YAVSPALHLNASVIYVGKKADNDFSTFPPTRVTLDDYLLLNLAVSWKLSGQFEVFARGENVADQKYEEVHGFGVPGAAGYVGGTVSF